MRGNSKRENREVLLVSDVTGWQSHQRTERSENASGGKSDMNADRDSDDFVVLSTQVNKAATAVAESVEGRRSPKGSFAELSPMLRTQSRIEYQLEWHGNHDW